MKSIICVLFGSVLSLSVGYPSVKNSQGSLLERYPLSSASSLQALDSQTITRRQDSSSHPGLTQVIINRPGYATEFNVRQDAPIAEDELQGDVRSRLKRETDETEAEDDSDMYMEPEEEPEEKETNEEEPGEKKQDDNHGMSQHFFPSFAPVFGLANTRPELFRQEPAFNQPRPAHLLRSADFTPFKSFRDTSYQPAIAAQEDVQSSNLLGSGNFGVIRGGTYYSDDEYSESSYNPYYANNGHGRPSYYSNNPRPQKYSNGDFFANFRDFADINTPSKASFSEYVVVYVNKNASKHDTGSTLPNKKVHPKNIIEQLSLLDKEEEDRRYDSEEEDEKPYTVLSLKNEEKPSKKKSLHKTKLEKYKKEIQGKQKRYYKTESPKDYMYEPLLALS